MDDPLDVPLTDPELAAEIALVVDLIVHANASEVPLTQGEIDEILGLNRDDPDGVSARRNVRPTRPSIEHGASRRALHRLGAASLARIRGVVRSRK